MPNKLYYKIQNSRFRNTVYIFGFAVLIIAAISFALFILESTFDKPPVQRDVIDIAGIIGITIVTLYWSKKWNRFCNKLK